MNEVKVSGPHMWTSQRAATARRIRSS